MVEGMVNHHEAVDSNLVDPVNIITSTLLKFTFLNYESYLKVYQETSN